MPIVQGNEPPRRRSRPSVVGWLLPVIIFGPTLYRMARGAVAGRVTDQQLLIVGAGAVALALVVLIASRVSRARSTPARLPTGYPSTPPPVMLAGPIQTTASEGYTPRPLRYEPMVTSKVVLAGVAVAAMIGGFVALLVL